MANIEDYKIGMTVYGKVTGIKPYGAFVKFDDGVNGLIHISEISNGFVKSINSFMDVDEYVMAKVIDIDKEHKQLRLSFKALSQNNRRYVRRVKFEGMPENIKGFSTIKNKLPEWVRGDYHD